MKTSLLIVMATLTTLIAACSNGGGSTDAAPAAVPPANDDITPDQAKQRWPGKMSYSVSFTTQGCKDTYDYSDQAGFCLALTDDSKSQCEGLNDFSRQMSYKEHCGQDYSPRNFRAPFRASGFDTYIQQRCDIDTPERFVTVKALCEFYRNEDINKGCFWSARKMYFDRFKCDGEFSKPPAQAPEIPPVAQPLPQQPPPNPGTPSMPEFKIVDTWPEVTAQFQLMGITLVKAVSEDVSLEPGAIQGMPRTLSHLLPEFWIRRNSVKFLTITDGTVYDPETRSMDLSIHMNLENIKMYLQLHDKRISFEANTRLKVRYFVQPYEFQIIDSRFYEYAIQVNYMTTMQIQFSRIVPLFTNIEFGSVTEFDFDQKTLYLNRKTFIDDLYKPNYQLKTSLYLAQLAYSKIEFQGRLKNLTSLGFSAFFATLVINEENLKELAAASTDGLKIKFRQSSVSGAGYDSDTQTLSIAFTPTEFDSPELSRLLEIAPDIRRIGVPVKINKIRLDDRFVKCAKLFKDAFNTISNQKSKIKTIEFGSGTRSSFSNGYLTIAPDDTISHLTTVLLEIQ